MTLQPIEKHAEVVGQFKQQIEMTKSDSGLSEEGKVLNLKQIADKVDAQFKHWKEDVQTKKEQIEAETAALKPKVSDRKLDKDIVVLLTYQSKIIQSRVAAEGTTKAGFQALMSEIVDESGDLTVRAFLDNYADLIPIVDRFDFNGKGYLEDYYIRAKTKMKTPEQEAYEAAINESTGRSASLNTSIIVAERNLNDLRKLYSSELFGAGLGSGNRRVNNPWA